MGHTLQSENLTKEMDICPRWNRFKGNEGKKYMDLFIVTVNYDPLDFQQMMKKARDRIVTTTSSTTDLG